MIPLSALSEDSSDSRYIAENICVSNAPEAFEQAMDLLYLQHPDTDLYCGSFVVDEGNEYYRLVDGVLYSRDMSVLYGYPCGKRDWYFQVPSSVKAIGAYALSGNRHLRELVIPDSVAQIGAFAFHNTAVERLHLPSGEFEAGAEAFGWKLNPDKTASPGKPYKKASVQRIGQHKSLRKPLRKPGFLPTGDSPSKTIYRL